MLYVTYQGEYALVTCCRCLDAVPSCITCRFGPFTDEVADLAVESVVGMLRERGFRVVTG